MRYFILLLAFISPVAFGANAQEDTLHQVSEFIAIATMIFSFMLGMQFGHTR